MAGFLNKVTLIGNLGKDPEVRNSQGGDKIVSFSLATTDSWTDRASGEKRERTEWHRVVIFGNGLAGVAERYLKRGSKVYVEGALQTRKWTDQAGVERYATEIALKPYNGTMILLDGHRDGGSRPGGDDTGHAPAGGDRDDEIPY